MNTDPETTVRRILQIIPAPVGWRVLRFHLKHPKDEPEQMIAIVTPAACLALVHCRDINGDTERVVMPIAQDEQGSLEMCEPGDDAFLLEPSDEIEDFKDDGERAIERTMSVRALRHGGRCDPIVLVCGDYRGEVTFPRQSTADTSPHAPK